MDFAVKMLIIVSLALFFIFGIWIIVYGVSFLSVKDARRLQYKRKLTFLERVDAWGEMSDIKHDIDEAHKRNRKSVSVVISGSKYESEQRAAIIKKQLEKKHYKVDVEEILLGTKLNINWEVKE